MTWLSRLPLHDPDRINLRKAARATILAPGVFAFGLLALDNSTIAIYAFFATFVGLVFADYGGPPLRRAGAYAFMAVGGAAVVALGAELSDNTVAGAVGIFVVVGLAAFATSFGGYWSLHVSPMALGYSLSVLTPLSTAPLDDRVIGWVLGAAVSLLAALLLWPIERRVGLRESAAALARDLAAALDPSGRAGATAALEAAVRDAAALQAKAGGPLRPFGAAAHDVAFVHLIEHLEHAVDLARQVAEAGSAEVGLDDVDTEIAEALRRSADVLEGHREPETAMEQLAELDRGLLAERHQLIDVEPGGPQPDESLDRIETRLPHAALLHVAMWIEADAGRTMGASADAVEGVQSTPELRLPDSGPSETLQRARTIAGWELDLQGFVLRNSIRLAAALTITVVLANVLPVEHGFWITLAALSIIRSSAHSTTANALQAVLGTVIGFIVAAAVVDAAAGTDTLLWILLPITVALASYTPGALSFMVGQGAIAVLVVVLFNLIDPAGIETDVFRLETVVVGAVVAVAMSLLMWPRGARAALAEAASSVYEAAATAARAAMAQAAQDREAARRALDAAERRANAVLGAAINEHAQPIKATSWARLLRPPRTARALVVGLLFDLPTDPVPACDAAATVVRIRGQRVAAALADVSAALDPASSETSVSLGSPDVPGRAELAACLGASQDEPGATRRREAVTLIAWAMFLSTLRAEVEDICPLSEQLARGARRDFWSTPWRRLRG